MRQRLRRAVAASGGFLLCVLWFDLMFDTQVLAHARDVPLPEPVLASIAAYYQRVTIDAGMAPLVALAMAVAVLGSGWQLYQGTRPRALSAAAFVLVLGPVGLAQAKILPDAMRLAGRSDPIEVQSALARGICFAHITCLVMIVGFLAIQLFGPFEAEPRGGPGSKPGTDPRLH